MRHLFQKLGLKVIRPLCNVRITSGVVSLATREIEKSTVVDSPKEKLFIWRCLETEII